MKPIPAIVAPAELDIELCAQTIIVALADQRQAESSATRHEQLAGAARETAKMRRLEIGRELAKVRAAWPERGPKAKGWGEFLARIKLDDATARRYMDEYRDPAGFAQKQRALSENSGKGDVVKPANVHGGSGEVKRGSFCTPKKWALAVGPWDLDPFSSPNSHIVATHRCMLEDGGNGLLDLAVPGSYSAPPKFGRADETTRVWLQPPYERGFIDRVIAHYGHTRFCALLRWAPDTRWFQRMWPLVQLVAFPLERIPFETPDGVQVEGADDSDEDRGAPFPHAFYYRDPRDVTPAIAESCIVLSRYQAAAQPALQIVR